MILYPSTIFAGAFLLFLVQPLLGRTILPWYGGTPAVWIYCLLFFQTLLLAGYAYAHRLSRFGGPVRQAAIHIALLALSCLWLPVTPSAAWKPAGGDFPAWRILGLLATSVGAPYLLLSATSPLLQSWFARMHSRSSPYWLYSVSNLGSLLALALYPALLEPNLATSTQSSLWSWSYALFALACSGSALYFARGNLQFSATEAVADAAPVLSAGARIFWLLLSACGSVLLLATTNQLCLDVAVIPLLWILPLATYLVTFVICFHGSFLYSRIGFGIMLAGTYVQACLVLHKGVFVDLRLQVASYLTTLFICCMVCHGELVRARPAPRHLTQFYLIIAAGGVLGGLFTACAAPRIFLGYWEYHTALVATAVLLLVGLFRDDSGPLRAGRPLWAWSMLYLAVSGLAVALTLVGREMLKSSMTTSRNFYGILRVLDHQPEDPNEHRYTLMNGRIEHGFQFQAFAKRNWPTSYFGPGSGVGLALRYFPGRRLDRGEAGVLRVGVIGLGSGTLASYGRKGDTVCFYEINPEVARLANRYFTFLRDSLAEVQVVLGDGRISLERERDLGVSRQFDVLAVDAFTGDAIPIHLLTRECFEIYRYHLQKDGILAIHISNRYFDLAPVTRGLALLEKERGTEAVLISDHGNDEQGTDSTDWVLLTSNRRFLDSDEIERAVSPWPADGRPPILWTDDYSNLFRLFRSRE